MMNKFVNLLIVSLAILCLSHAANIPTPTTPAPDTAVQLRNIERIQDIRAYIKKHPLLLFNKKSAATRSQSVKYSLGARVSDDRLVAQYADTFFYPAKKDVTVQVTYPENGTGKVVTYVDIQCLQDNNDGNAYVVAGGIGQRFISLALEATQTERFTYNVHIYGTD